MDWRKETKSQFRSYKELSEAAAVAKNNHKRANATFCADTIKHNPSTFAGVIEKSGWDRSFRATPAKATLIKEYSAKGYNY